MLTGMAVHIFKAKYEAKDDSTSRVCHIFSASKDQKEIYYQFEDEPDITLESDAPAKTTTSAPLPIAAVPAMVATPTPPPTTANPVAGIGDVLIHAVDVLAVIISQILRKQLNEILLSKSIKDLPNGKSTL